MRLDTVMVSSLFLCNFWIRSPGTRSEYVAYYVKYGGVVDYYDYTSDSYGLFYYHSYIYTNCKKGAMKYEIHQRNECTRYSQD